MTYDELHAKLAAHGQQHVLRFWHELTHAERQALARDVAAVDLALVERLVREEHAGEDWAALARRAEPPEAIRLNGPDRAEKSAAARERGRQALAAGQVGIVLVAGGQGTRLGFDHPKGMYPIGPVSGASLFQILFEKALAVSRRYEVAVPFCVMTGPATHEETVEYLGDRDYFGLPREDVRIFCQGTMPAVDAESGRLLLAERSRLALSPDGHGGMLAALERQGLLGDLQRRGVRQLFTMQVDSPLVQVCDAEFLGFHVLARAEMSTQVVAKRDSADCVGNLVQVDGRARIIEYSDLPDDAAERRQPDGALTLWAGNIAVHAFDLDFLVRMAAEAALPFHRANKKVPYVDERGALREPSAPNALKFERFIFDLLPRAARTLAVEVDEAEAFAPLKNASGAAKDTPETVRAAMLALHTRWLRRAGAVVDDGVPVEIGPPFALDAEEVARKVSRGMRVTGPRYFG